jgi:hypothetical protein
MSQLDMKRYRLRTHVAFRSRRSAEPDITVDQLSHLSSEGSPKGEPYLLGNSKVSQPSLHHIGFNLHRSGTTLSRRSWATNQHL